MIWIREYLARSVGVLALVAAQCGLLGCGARAELDLAPGAAPATGGAPAGSAMPPATGGAPAGTATPPATGGAPAGTAVPPATGGAPAGTAVPPATGGAPAGTAVPPATGGAPPGNVPSQVAECARDQDCSRGERCTLGVCTPSCADGSPDLVIPEGETRYLQGPSSYCNLVVAGRVQVQPYNGVEGGQVRLHAAERLVILPQGVVAADGCGYRSDEGPGAGNCQGGGSSGGGYGGPGGAGCCQGLFAPVYGEAGSLTIEMGSGGATGRGCGEGLGGSGGGAISLSGRTIAVFGQISASGTAERTPSMWSPGAGSGGGILMIADVIDISGTLSAFGGTPSEATWGGGGGGGGRIKLFASALKLAGKILVHGGAGGKGNWNGNPGGDGSIYTGR